MTLNIFDSPKEKSILFYICFQAFLAHHVESRSYASKQITNFQPFPSEKELLGKFSVKQYVSSQDIINLFCFCCIYLSCYLTAGETGCIFPVIFQDAVFWQDRFPVYRIGLKFPLKIALFAQRYMCCINMGEIIKFVESD